MRANRDRTSAQRSADGANRLSVVTVAMRPDHDPLKSRIRLCELIDRVKAEHPDVRLIHFGEAILGWFNRATRDESIAYHREIGETVPGPTTVRLGEIARSHNVFISFGLTEQDEEKVFNTQVLINPNGEIIAKHRKFWLRTPYFEPAERRLTLADVDGARLAIVICADVRSFWLMRAIRKARVDIVLASLADTGTDVSLNRMMGSFYDAWSVVANRYGKEPHNDWQGLITITDRWGRLRAHGIGMEQFLHFEIPLGRTGSALRRLRRILVFGRLVGLALAFVLRPVVVAVARRMGRRSAGR